MNDNSNLRTSKSESLISGALDKLDHDYRLSHEEAKALRTEFLRLRQSVGLVDPRVRGFLARVLARFQEADAERYTSQKEWEADGQKSWREGDGYGYNFHQGMGAGANWAAIFFWRVQRELETILKELPAESPDETVGWRLIESCPKDGTPFLCGWWTSDGDYWWTVKAHWANGAVNGGWDGARQPVDVDPTHWMPLPEPPRSSVKASGEQT